MKIFSYKMLFLDYISRNYLHKGKKQILCKARLKFSPLPTAIKHILLKVLIINEWIKTSLQIHASKCRAKKFSRVLAVF